MEQRVLTTVFTKDMKYTNNRHEIKTSNNIYMPNTGKGKTPKVVHVIICLLILFLVIWAQICPDLLQYHSTQFHQFGCIGPDEPWLAAISFHQCGATRPDYGHKMAHLGPFSPFRGPMAPPMATSVPWNGSNASAQMSPDLLQSCSAQFHQFGATRPDFCHKMAHFGHLSPFRGPMAPPMVTSDPLNCSIASAWMCFELLQSRSTLFHQFGATRSGYGHKMDHCGPISTFRPLLIHEMVPMHRPGGTLTCSNLVPHCSTSLEQPDPLISHTWTFWSFLPFWAIK